MTISPRVGSAAFIPTGWSFFAHLPLSLSHRVYIRPNLPSSISSFIHYFFNCHLLLYAFAYATSLSKLSCLTEDASIAAKRVTTPCKYLKCISRVQSIVFLTYHRYIGCAQRSLILLVNALNRVNVLLNTCQ